MGRRISSVRRARWRQRLGWGRTSSWRLTNAPSFPWRRSERYFEGHKNEVPWSRRQPPVAGRQHEQVSGFELQGSGSDQRTPNAKHGTGNFEGATQSLFG